MLNLLIRKKDFLHSRLDMNRPVLILSSNSNSLHRNKLEQAGFENVTIQGILETLQDLQKKTSSSGRPLVYDKLSVSGMVWREFMRQQTRYDLVLTNAFVLSDDLSEPIGDLAGGVRFQVSSAPSRSAMEGWGSFVSLYNAEESAVYRLSAALYSLILPVAGLDLHEKVDLKQQCPRCLQAWPLRLNYLRALYQLQQGNLEQACQALPKESYLSPETLQLRDSRVKYLQNLYLAFENQCREWKK